MRRFGDALLQALHGMVRNGLLTFVSIFVLVSCLLFIGSFALISKNIDYNLEDITDLNEIEVFLEYDADAATAARIGDEIRALDNVESVTYVSKEEGLREVAGEFAEYAYLLDDITPEENPLSDCYRITYADNAGATTLDYELKQIKGVRKVNSRLDLAATIGSLQNGISVIFVWFAVLCGVVSLFVIINTIKLSVYARREEIAIMRYIGAGRAYIAGAAYFLEKLIYSGLSSFVLSEVGIVKMYSYSAMTPMLLAIFFAISLFCGIVGSIVSLGRYVEA